jgi:hypothetical protein
VAAARDDLKCIAATTKETCKAPCLYDPSTQAICFSPASIYNTADCAPGITAARCMAPLAVAGACAGAATQAACAAVGHCALSNGTCQVDVTNYLAVIKAMGKAATSSGAVLLPAVYQAQATCFPYNSYTSCTLATYNYTIQPTLAIATATASRPPPAAAAPPPRPAPSRLNSAAAAAGGWRTLAAAAAAALALALAPAM